MVVEILLAGLIILLMARIIFLNYKILDEQTARKNAMEAAKTAQEAQRRSEERFEDHRKQMTEFLAKPLQINFNSEEIAQLLAHHLAPHLHRDWIN